MYLDEFYYLNAQGLMPIEQYIYIYIIYIFINYYNEL